MINMKGKITFGSGEFRHRSVHFASVTNGQGAEVVRLSVYAKGGNLAEYVFSDRHGIPRNILFEAPWHQFDPDVVKLGDKTFDYYGGDDARKRVASVGGSSLCFPTFGPGKMEVTGGLHGEANIVEWKLVETTESYFSIEAHLPITGWRVRRFFGFNPGRSWVKVTTEFENLDDSPKNVTWAEHMNFGEFALGSSLELPKGTKVFNYHKKFHDVHSLFREGGQSIWPLAEGKGGWQIDMSTFSVPGYPDMRQSDFTAQVIDPSNPSGWFVLRNERLGIALVVNWPREEAPFLARWIENRARTPSPWSGRTQMMGLEWGRSPWADGVDSAVGQKSHDGNQTYINVAARGSFSTEFSMRAVAEYDTGDPLNS